MIENEREIIRGETTRDNINTGGGRESNNTNNTRDGNREGGNRDGGNVMGSSRVGLSSTTSRPSSIVLPPPVVSSSATAKYLQQRPVSLSLTSTNSSPTDEMLLSNADFDLDMGLSGGGGGASQSSYSYNNNSNSSHIYTKNEAILRSGGPKSLSGLPSSSTTNHYSFGITHSLMRPTTHPRVYSLTHTNMNTPTL